jgi:hypothetical protein
MAEPTVSASLFNQVSQLAHFAGGLAGLWGSVVLFHPRHLWIPMLVIAGVTGLKEFWYDQHYETPVVRGSNFEDWTFYQVGSLTALLLTIGVTWFHVHG